MSLRKQVELSILERFRLQSGYVQRVAVVDEVMRLVESELLDVRDTLQDEAVAPLKRIGTALVQLRQALDD